MANHYPSFLCSYSSLPSSSSYIHIRQPIQWPWIEPCVRLTINTSFQIWLRLWPKFNLIKSFLTNRVMKVVLNGHASRSFHINGPTLFLIFINDLLNVISSPGGIYAGDTIIYSCLNTKSDRSDKIKLVAALESEPNQLLNGTRNDLYISTPPKRNCNPLIIIENHFCSRSA